VAKEDSNPATNCRSEAERKARERETSLMTEEELKAEHNRLMAESIEGILAAQPEIAVAVLEGLGITVIPPADAE
jgi:hypothetical protein